MLVERRRPHADHLPESTHGQCLGALGLDELARGPDDLRGPRGALLQRRSRFGVGHLPESTKTGCRGAIRVSSSSLELPSTPSKNTPTSAFQRFRYARSTGTL